MKYRWLFLCIALVAATGAACEDAGSPSSPTDHGLDPVVELDASRADAAGGEHGERDGSAERDGGVDGGPRGDASTHVPDAARADAAGEDFATTDAAQTAPPEAGAASVRYGADVRPILERHCTKCHSSGAGAPFGLTFYEEVAPLANDLRSAIVSGTMPPCNLLGTIDCGLSKTEVDTVSLWVAQGALR